MLALAFGVASMKSSSIELVNHLMLSSAVASSTSSSSISPSVALSSAAASMRSANVSDLFGLAQRSPKVYDADLEATRQNIELSTWQPGATRKNEHKNQINKVSFE